MDKKENSIKTKKKKLSWSKLAELLKTYKFLLIIPLFLIFLFWKPPSTGFLAKLLSKFKFLLGYIWWSTCGALAGAFLWNLFKNKGQLILNNTPEFLSFCEKSNGLVFFGPIDSGKTAIMAMLAQELPGENKYATFPCSLPWMNKSQIDFSNSPSQPLGVQETIFLDEMNLQFKGNIIQEVRERQRFLMHFIALSRHQGTRIFANIQRLGQFSIEQREIVTAVCQVSKIGSRDEGIYVKCIIWQSAAWSQEKTKQEYTVFVPKRHLDTYNSYWLKSLKYLRRNQNYIYFDFIEPFFKRWV